MDSATVMEVDQNASLPAIYKISAKLEVHIYNASIPLSPSLGPPSLHNA